MSTEYIPVAVFKRAIDGIDRARQCDMATSHDYTLKNAIKTVLEWTNTPDYAETLKAAEVSTEAREVAHGHWNEDDIGYDPFLTCSECGLSLSKGDYTREEWQEVFNYCPCCGADMREVKE